MLARRSSLAALVLACGCAKDPSREPVVHADEPPRAVPVWAGCDDYVGDTCLFVTRDSAPPLRAWVDTPPSTPLTVQFDGVLAQPTSSTLADGGTHVVVAVPEGATEVVLSGTGIRGRLAIVWHESHPSLLAARKAAEAKERDRLCELMKKLPAEMSGYDQMDAKGLSIACIDANDANARFEAFKETAEIAAAHGLRRGFVRAVTPTLWTLVEQKNDPATARAWLARMQTQAAGIRELEVWASYAKMLVDRREGALSDALSAATHVVEWSDRLRMVHEFAIGSEIRATLLAELGRVSEARELATSLVTTAQTQQDACARARILNNAAWTRQVLAEAGLDDPPLDLMLEEAEIYESGECDNQRDRMIARINVATAALSEHDVALAAEWLELLLLEDRMEAAPDLGAQIDHLGLGVAMERNRWEDVSHPFFVAAPAVGDRRLRWHAAVREAGVLERFGLIDAAVDGWRRAEAILDEDTAAVGMSSGRESFISGRSASAIGLVEALVRRGELDQALCRARIARGRALRQAVRGRGNTPTQIAAYEAFLRVREELERDATADWSFAGDELVRRRARREERRHEAMAALAIALPQGAADSDCAALHARGDDEVLLLLLPTREDTLVLVAGPNGTIVERLPAIPNRGHAVQQWADELLVRISPSLAGTTRIRVLPVAGAWSVALHAATFEGRPLVDRFAVSYGLDLPGGRPLAGEPTRVLVVADPTGDLPHATTEGERVRALFAARQLDVQVLTGSSALREDVLAKLATTELFHYSGHGEHRGRDGWDDALLLHDRASVESADVLALAHVPRTVVLAGCDTGAVNAGLFDGGMSLGRAFLLAGSEAVVVGDRKVDDAVTEGFAVALYEGSAQRMLDTPELAVRDALRKTAASGVPVSAWSGFRLLVR